MVQIYTKFSEENVENRVTEIPAENPNCSLAPPFLILILTVIFAVNDTVSVPN